jgi:hypothetical protein
MLTKRRNAASSIGYLIGDSWSAFSANGLTSAEWSALFTGLAGLLSLGCILYLALWLLYERPLRPDVLCWATVLSLLGALVYLLSSSLFFIFPAQGKDGKLALASVAVQGALNLLATTIYLFSALLYNSAYYAGRPGTWTLFFAEFFNTLPSLGYAGTATFQILVMLKWGIQTDPNAHHQLIVLVSMLNFVCDLMFVFDALLCAKALRDAAHEEEKVGATGEEIRSLI